MKTFFRWLAVLPGAVLAALLADYLVTIGHTVTYKMGFDGKTSLVFGLFFAGIAGAFAAVTATGNIAPTHKRGAVIAVCVLIFAGSAFCAYGNAGNRYQVARFVGYCGAALMAAISYPKEFELAK